MMMKRDQFNNLTMKNKKKLMKIEHTPEIPLSLRVNSRSLRIESQPRKHSLI